MRIAVAAEGSSEEAPVSFRAARAPYYLIFEDGKLVEVVTNPFINERGVGPRVAAMLAEKGVDVVVAGDFGPNMENTLRMAGIRTVRASGRVKDVINSL